MIEIFRGYIQTKNKKCIQKFGHGEPLMTLEQAMQYEEFAGVLNGRFTIIDTDVKESAEAFLRLVTELNLNCRIYRTTRGYHFVFENSGYITKNITKKVNALGLEFDCRHGQNAYIIVKFAGAVREIIREFDESRLLDKIPKYLMPVAGAKALADMVDGDGRNSALYAHIIPLMRSGFSVEESRQVINLINKHIFAEPLSNEELKLVLRDDAFKNINAGANDDFESIGIKPADFSEAGVAEVFVRLYKDTARYCTAEGWLVWDGKRWEASDLKAQELQIDLTRRLLKDARNEVQLAYVVLADAEVSSDKDTVNKAKEGVKSAKSYYSFALSQREAPKIAGVLKLARSAMEIKVDALDANPYEINTPDGIVDLKTGEIGPHRPEAYCTKITRFGPGDDGKDMWLSCVDMVAIGDREYVNYLLCLAGMIAVGRLMEEKMIIAHGSGSNGKSTLFNTMASVLGDYAGRIPAESLTTRAKSVKVDLAELCGKRMIIAAETEEGQRLSTSMLKMIASTDTLTAERKYHDPFTFSPTHTVILYTNHLPKVGSGDHGTWRRLAVAPFYASIKEPQTDYAEKLLKKAGGAVMKWIVIGAKTFITHGCKLPSCKAVEDAISQYRQANNWLSAFLEERCIVGKPETCSGGELYTEYRLWGSRTGEYIRSTSDFAAALTGAGFERQRAKTGSIWRGLSIAEDALFSPITPLTIAATK